MAQTQKQTAASRPNLPPDAPPDGGDWAVVGTPDIHGWWRPKEGSVVMGRLVGRLTIDDESGGRDVILMQLMYDCSDATLNQQPTSLKKGEVLGIGVREKIRDVLSYVEHQGVAWIKAVEKVNIGNGRTMWKFETRCKGMRAVPPAPAPAKSVSDDIPF